MCVCVCVCVCLQVVLTTIEPQGAAKGSGYDAYEYTAHSYSFITDQLPAVRLTYDVSPIQVRRVCVCVCVCVCTNRTLTVCTGLGWRVQR